jgi:hypothetical protein
MGSLLREGTVVVVREDREGVRVGELAISNDD